MPCFKEDLPWLDIEYSGSGHEIARQFYIPVLKASQRYDRVSGYFSVDSLSVVSAGFAGLIRNRGRVRLIMGLHDLGPQLREAYIISRDQAEKLVKEIGERIASGLDTVEDVFERRRLEALAWMLAEGLMEIKVAVPKRVLTGLGNGIFHMKRLVLYDEDGCIISADGSANETRRAWEENGENLTIHMSWREGSLEYIRRHQDRFEALWGDRNPEYNVFGLPEAVDRKLRERYYPETPPDSDPVETAKPAVKRVDYDECRHLYAASQLVLRARAAAAAKLVRGLGSDAEPFMASMDVNASRRSA